MYLWKAEQIRQAVERCEKEVEAMVLMEHARPEEIEKKREGVETLRRWLAEAERNEALRKVRDA